MGSIDRNLDAFDKEWSELNRLRNEEMKLALNARLRRNEAEEREHLARAKWLKEEMDACEDVMTNIIALADMLEAEEA